MQGLLDFQQREKANYQEQYGHLAAGQKPEALFITCSDSRVVPQTFTSSPPGRLFMLRNVGNLVPSCTAAGELPADTSVAAAVAFALEVLHVPHIIVCGHSACGAMQAVQQGSATCSASLACWLQHSEPARALQAAGGLDNQDLSAPDQLAQYNVLAQLAHLKTYPAVQAALAAGAVQLQGWWYDLATARVLIYARTKNNFESVAF